MGITAKIGEHQLHVLDGLDSEIRIGLDVHSQCAWVVLAAPRRVQETGKVLVARCDDAKGASLDSRVTARNQVFRDGADGVVQLLE